MSKVANHSVHSKDQAINCFVDIKVLFQLFKDQEECFQ